MKAKNFFNKIIFALNILLAISTLLAYCAPYISPNTFWLFAFFGLTLPYLLIANLIFGIYWLVQGNSKFVIAIVILGLGYKTIPGFIQLQLKNEVIEEKDFKVMSFNVRVFDLYMWSKEKTTRNKILDFLKIEDPDVLCLQEFYHRDKQLNQYEFKTLDTLVTILTAQNYHLQYTTTLRGTDHWGIITFSKYPIVNKGSVELEGANDNVCIYSDLLINNRNIRIYNAHLASIKLEKRDYKTMQKINENDYENGYMKSKELITKIKSGFEKRALQAEKIKESIKKSPYPVVICGDFNDTPSSYAYNTIKGSLNDAYLEKGSGLGQTYIGEFPSFRIDYILSDKILKIKNFNTHQIKLSDHKPVSAVFTFNE